MSANLNKANFQNLQQKDDLIRTLFSENEKLKNALNTNREVTNFLAHALGGAMAYGLTGDEAAKVALKATESLIKLLSSKKEKQPEPATATPEGAAHTPEGAAVAPVTPPAPEVKEDKKGGK